jgi:putative FmdB family regulatory protein
MRGKPLPSYLFHCRDCLKPFTKQLSFHDYEQGGLVCPICGSNKVEEQLSLFYPLTLKNGA